MASSNRLLFSWFSFQPLKPWKAEKDRMRSSKLRNNLTTTTTSPLRNFSVVQNWLLKHSSCSVSNMTHSRRAWEILGKCYVTSHVTCPVASFSKIKAEDRDISWNFAAVFPPLASQSCKPCRWSTRRSFKPSEVDIQTSSCADRAVCFGFSAILTLHSSYSSRTHHSST